jgi:hypothetical protein
MVTGFVGVMDWIVPTPPMDEPCDGFTTLTESDGSYICSRVRGRTGEAHTHPKQRVPDDVVDMAVRFEYSAS